MKINWTKAKLTKYGLTNINYSYLDYIIRKSQTFCDIFLDRKTEQLVLPLVKNINVPVIDYFQNDKICRNHIHMTRFWFLQACC